MTQPLSLQLASIRARLVDKEYREQHGDGNLRKQLRKPPSASRLDAIAAELTLAARRRK